MAGFFEELFGTEDPEVPELSPEAQAVQAGQFAQLQRAGGLQQELQPFQLAQLGFTRDAEGNLRRLTEEEQLPAQQAQALLQQRFLSALRGEIPSPALERDIERQRALLGEDIARRGQIGGTAEAQRRGAFQEASLIARESARQAQLTQTGQIQTGQANLLSQRLAQLRGEPLAAIPLIQAGATALQPSLQQQQLGFQSKLAGQQARGALARQLIPEVSIGL